MSQYDVTPDEEPLDMTAVSADDVLVEQLRRSMSPDAAVVWDDDDDIDDPAVALLRGLQRDVAADLPQLPSILPREVTSLGRRPVDRRCRSRPAGTPAVRRAHRGRVRRHARRGCDHPVVPRGSDHRHDAPLAVAGRQSEGLSARRGGSLGGDRRGQGTRQCAAAP
jgi:hypothetical protein